MSPNVEERQTTAYVTTSGSMPSDASLLKDEPQTNQMPMNRLLILQDDREVQPHDSEDSLSQERIANELRQLTERQARAPQSSEEGAAVPISEGATAPPSGWNRQGPTAQIPHGNGKVVVPMHLRDQEDTGVDYSLRIPICLILPSG